MCTADYVIGSIVVLVAIVATVAMVRFVIWVFRGQLEIQDNLEKMEELQRKAMEAEDGCDI